MSRLIELSTPQIGVSFIKDQNGPLIRQTISVENLSSNVVEVTFPTTVPGVTFNPQTFTLDPKPAAPNISSKSVDVIYDTGLLNRLPAGQNVINLTVSSKAVTTTPNPSKL